MGTVIKPKFFAWALVALVVLLASIAASLAWYEKYYLPGNAPPDREKILRLALSKLSPEQLAAITAEAERKGALNASTAYDRFGHALDVWMNCDKRKVEEKEKRGEHMTRDDGICMIPDMVTVTQLYGPPSQKSALSYLVEGLVEPCMRLAQTAREAIRVGCQPKD